MESLNFDATTLLICGALCIGGVVLVFLLQFLGSIFGLLFGVIDFFLGILTGGPESWCGCLVFLGIAVLCVVVTVSMFGLLSTCGTEDAVNFCRFF
jgi:hypothetical protein